MPKYHLLLFNEKLQNKKPVIQMMETVFKNYFSFIYLIIFNK